jgi:hypothetical protein
MNPRIQHFGQTLKNRATLLAALALTIAACYLLVAPPI